MNDRRPKKCRSSDWARSAALIPLLALTCGCGSRVDGPSAKFTAARAPLRVQVNEVAGSYTSCELLGLSDDELTALSNVDEARRKDALRVSVAAATDDLPSISGDVQRIADGVRFTPRYPLRPGLRYRVVWNRRALLPDSASSHEFDEESCEFEIARASTRPTSITHIYPSAEQLPENQLKFYIHFSSPMSRGGAYERIHLLDGAGNELSAVFLELGEELWDREMCRFTLLLDPGRVKRGLVPRAELGPVLESGRDYTLVVDKDWIDAEGRPLDAGAEKRFHTLPADDQSIDVAAWSMDVPAAGTLDPLVVRFPEALDHALLLRMLRVMDDRQQPCPGSTETHAAETAWQFTPEREWAAGDYELLVDTALEDLAGNAVGRAFDVDTFGPARERVEGSTVSRPFVVGAKAAQR